MTQELSKEEYENKIAELLECEQKLQENRTLWRRYLLDQAAIEDYERNMRAYREEGREEGYEEGRAEGIEIGLARGEEIGQEKLARNLKLLGFLDDEKISLVSGLPIEVVKAL